MYAARMLTLAEVYPFPLLFQVDETCSQDRHRMHKNDYVVFTAKLSICDIDYKDLVFVQL